ncbi:hypothetical protein EUX98_g7149 [Antrodiella citrinella]|uniref:G-protein coupled receptors family 1 profile domain-containing protein n=1 Tax=Antrodiella citrinella TaxID=2447956 RepID=A0A4S4MMA3_9APHY|nr:hypothetical protein EUX98_g7149 [Antrodiella citrinella]
MMLDKRVTAEQIGPNGSSFLAGWLFLQITANHVFLPILVTTFLFSKSAARHPAIINVCITWIVSGIMSSILFYVGRESGADPRQGICVAQASLTSGIAPMTTTALLILAIYISMSLTPFKEDPRIRRAGFMFNPALLMLPYLVFVLFASIGVGIALQHPDRVSREQRFFYCSLEWPAFRVAVTVISTLVCLTAVVMEVRVWRILSRNWRDIRESGGMVDVDVVVRTSVFTFYLFVSTLINLAANWSKSLQQSAAPDMISASIGMALFLTFVSHGAVLRTWAFWKRHPGTASSHPPSQSIPSNRTSSFLQMPTLSHSGQPDTSSSHTYLGSDTLIKQYYEGKVGPNTSGGVTIIRKPDEAFGGYVRDRDDSSDSEDHRRYSPQPRERLVTAVEYDHSRTRASSLRRYDLLF